MCLACEMDAMWYAEIEAASGTAGVPPALSGQSGVIESELHVTAGGTPAVPGNVPASSFVCEETTCE